MTRWAEKAYRSWCGMEEGIRRGEKEGPRSNDSGGESPSQTKGANSLLKEGRLFFQARQSDRMKKKRDMHVQGGRRQGEKRNFSLLKTDGRKEGRKGEVSSLPEPGREGVFRGKRNTDLINNLGRMEKHQVGYVAQQASATAGATSLVQ